MNLVGTKNESTRDKWVEEKLRSLPEGTAILDAGAGEQKYRKFCGHMKYTSQDFCQYDGKGDGHANQTGSWDVSSIDIVSDITDIPCPDSSFGAILCTEVFEHIVSPESAVKEFSRLMKKDAVLILTALFCSLSHFTPYHYGTGFNRYWYEAILAKYGFAVTEMILNGNYFEYIAQEIRRLPAVAGKYSHSMGILSRIARIMLLLGLDRLSKKDCGISETLCFGYHVLARKL